jgi:hypothetical protein
VNDKLTIQQIRGNEPESLWHFLSQLPSSFEAELLLGLLIAGFIGAMISWLIKWSSGEAHGLIDYCFKNSIKRTVAAVMAFLGLVAGFIVSDMFTTASGEFVGWMNVMVNGFMAGSGSDAIINKGKRTEWSAEKRALTQPKESP